MALKFRLASSPRLFSLAVLAALCGASGSHAQSQTPTWDGGSPQAPGESVPSAHFHYSGSAPPAPSSYLSEDDSDSRDSNDGDGDSGSDDGGVRTVVITVPVIRYVRNPQADRLARRINRFATRKGPAQLARFEQWTRDQKARSAQHMEHSRDQEASRKAAWQAREQQSALAALQQLPPAPPSRNPRPSLHTPRWAKLSGEKKWLSSDPGCDCHNRGSPDLKDDGSGRVTCVCTNPSGMAMLPPEYVSPAGHFCAQGVPSYNADGSDVVGCNLPNGSTAPPQCRCSDGTPVANPYGAGCVCKTYYRHVCDYHRHPQGCPAVRTGSKGSP